MEAPADAARQRRRQRIINGRTDVNQLVPFKYNWAWEKYLSACATTGCRRTIQMSRDIELWKIRRLPMTNGAGQAPISGSSYRRLAAANNIVLGTYRHITRRNAGSTCCEEFEEAYPYPSLPVHRRELGLDKGEVFNAYHEIASIRDKDEF